jgi:hypothetical protein
MMALYLRNLLRVSPHASDTSSIFSFQVCFNSGEPAKGGSDGAQNSRCDIIVEEKGCRAFASEGARELRGKQDDVKERL